MRGVLLMSGDRRSVYRVGQILRHLGYRVLRPPSDSGDRSINPEHLAPNAVVVVDVQLQDADASTLLLERRTKATLAVVGNAGLELEGAAQPTFAAALADAAGGQRSVTALASAETAGPAVHESGELQRPPTDLAAHAAARWATTVVRIVDSPRDTRTIAEWARWIGASSGALRNWCHTAGIPPRRSLVFGRMLRAFILSQTTSHRFENLLDVVDRRTLVGLLRLAGLSGGAMPGTVTDFLRRQALVRDAAALDEIERALARRLKVHAA